MIRRSFAVAIALALVPSSVRAEDAAASARPKSEDEAVQRAIDRVYPALVQIHVLSLAHDSGHERKQEGAGSGAIISPDGYAVTNHHVAGKASTIRVILSSKEELDATLVGTDALADIAVVKLDLSRRAKDAPPLPVAKWGRSEQLKVGDVVLAMGCPLALSHSVTKGIVANKEMMQARFVRSSSFVLDGEDVGSIVKWIGHDATIQPGNSGGPLVNLDGEIIGINEIGMGSMSGAIPSEIASAVSKELIEHGKVRRSWVGIEAQSLLKSEPGANATLEGVLVGGLIPDSPAEKAGVKPGDLIVAVDGTPVKARFREELPAFNMLLLSKPVGKPVELKLVRDGKEVAVTVTSDLRDDAEGREVEVRSWGVTAREITTMEAKELLRADKKGVMVGSVRPGGPCDQAQPTIRPGDIVVEIGGKPVDGLDSFLAITAAIVEGKTDPVPTVIAYEREAQRLLTLVEIGTKKPQDPTPEAKKPWLAVETQVLSKKLAAALGLKGKKGVRITRIYPETSAEEAGFQIGDVITHVDGQVVEASEAHDQDVFAEMVRGYKVGTKAAFTVWRDGKKSEISTVLGEAPKPERELREHEDVVLEMKVRDISFFDRVRHRWKKEETGVLVTGLEAGGWASFGGIHAGDLIRAVDGKSIATVAELEPLLKEIHDKRPRTITFLVRRGIHTLFLQLEPTWPAAAEKK